MIEIFVLSNRRLSSKGNTGVYQKNCKGMHIYKNKEALVVIPGPLCFLT
jgi:hypothetical protein